MLIKSKGRARSDENQDTRREPTRPRMSEYQLGSCRVDKNFVQAKTHQKREETSIEFTDSCLGVQNKMFSNNFIQVVTQTHYEDDRKGNQIPTIVIMKYW